MSRRHQIKMDDAEVVTFLEEERTVICATLGRDGWPHLMPLWYVLRVDGGSAEIWAWTYAASQKARNLERDARATLEVEAGEQYHLLRGVMLECDVVMHRDAEVVEGVAMALVDRYTGTGPDSEPARELFRAQVPKRVGLQFVERRRVSWDHRKLGGVY
jgi:PPOX class probable F420-dependent enzyme